MGDKVELQEDSNLGWDFGHARGRHLTVPRLIFSMLLLMSVRCVEQHFAEHILDAVIHGSQMCRTKMISRKKKRRGLGSKKQLDNYSHLYCSFQSKIHWSVEGLNPCIWTEKNISLIYQSFPKGIRQSTKRMANKMKTAVLRVKRNKVFACFAWERNMMSRVICMCFIPHIHTNLTLHIFNSINTLLLLSVFSFFS